MDSQAPSEPTAARERWPGAWIRWLEWTVLLSGAGVLAWLTLSSWRVLLHAHPLLDDYTVAVLGQDMGTLGYANWIWLEKSGRWTGHALLAFVLARVDLPRAYPWLLAALALINLGATFTFLRVVLAETVSKRALFAVALAFEALLWAGRPVPSQTLYWFAGAIPYQTSLSGAVFLIAGLIARSRRRLGGHWTIGFVLATVFLVGLQELIGIVLALLLAVSAWVAHRQRLPGRSLWPWCTVAALLACGASLSAPGNSVRGEEWPRAGELGLTLRTSLQDSLTFARAWILEPRLLGASLFLWLSPAFRSLRPRWVDSGTRWVRIVVPVSVLSLALLVAGPRWATGTWQPLRMRSVDYVVLFHAWFVVLFLLTRGPRGLPSSPAVQSLGRMAAVLLLAYGSIYTGNGQSVRVDAANGSLARWDAYMDEREATLRAAAARGTKRVALEPAPDFPWIFEKWMDLSSEDPGQNAFTARYFGLRHLVVKKPGAGASPK